MALVVLLRGINVGGHRTFRPTMLARQLQHLDVVNIAATGTFVFRKPIGRRQLRAEIAERMPFDAEIVVCEGREIVSLVSRGHFADYPPRGDIVRFVSVLCRLPRRMPSLPMTFPPRGDWLLKLLARDGRFVFGVYRRDMKVIAYLGELERVFGASATTRNWNTFSAIAKVLSGRARTETARQRVANGPGAARTQPPSSGVRAR